MTDNHQRHHQQQQQQQQGGHSGKLSSRSPASRSVSGLERAPSSGFTVRTMLDPVEVEMMLEDSEDGGGDNDAGLLLEASSGGAGSARRTASLK